MNTRTNTDTNTRKPQRTGPDCAADGQQDKTDMQRTDFSRLASSDLDQILALERICFSTPWNEKQFNLAFEQKIFNIFGLKQNDTLVAYMAFYHAADEMEILNIGVCPTCRRLGAGRRLLGLVLQIAHKMGIQQAFLEVRRSNAPARGLYAGFGFEHVGVRKGYYTDTGEDALLMRRALAGTVAFSPGLAHRELATMNSAKT